jgi:hypothetical protein
MTTVEANSNYYVEFQPFLVRVEVPDRTEVNISHFSVPQGRYDTNYRGVANIDIDGDDGTEITLHVYITPHERLKGTHIRVFKSGKWEDYGDNFTQDFRRNWAGYLTTTLTKGDPPIAVG